MTGMRNVEFHNLNKTPSVLIITMCISTIFQKLAYRDHGYVTQNSSCDQALPAPHQPYSADIRINLMDEFVVFNGCGEWKEHCDPTSEDSSVF